MHSPHLTLTARLTDGRCARWSQDDGWSGDVDVIHAAQAVADLYPDLPAHTRAARGLFGASVDGWVCETTWQAARL